MKTVLRSVLALLLGVLVGGSVNMGLVLLGPHVIPTPAGVDVNDLRASSHLLEPRHFLFPFLAHAIGTLSGAFVGCLVGVRYRTAIAYAIGAFFLAGGVAAAFMIPAPIWFISLDLLLAYIPMAWLGSLAAHRLREEMSRAQPT